MQSVWENKQYREAMRQASKSAISASVSNSESREAWARTAQAWLGIAREIREASGVRRPVTR